MAVSLTEAAKFTTNMVKRGVLEIIIKDSIVLQKMKFIEITGNAYQYLRETTLPTAEFYDPNEVWSESTGDHTQFTAALKIMGGDADVDNFIQATRSDKTDVAADAVAMKAKAVKHAFLDKFWYGDTSSSTKQFDGLHKIFLGSDMSAQQIHEGSAGTGTALNATNMDAMMDLVLDGMGDCIVTTRRTRRLILQYLRAKNNIDFTTSNFGKPIQAWGGVPLYYDDFLVDTETITGTTYSAKTGGATSSIFYLRFGSDDLIGLQNGDLQTIKIGQLEAKDARRWRIRWYVSLALMRSISAALIDGITSAAMAD